MIAEDVACSKEIRGKQARGQSAETGMKQIWKSHGIKLTIKVRLMKALVWPVATYGCKSWTIKKRDERRIEAFEIKCIRRILRVSWTQKKTNEWVLETAGMERGLLNMIKRRKLSYFGHVGLGLMRKEGDCLEKESMQGTTPGARKQGKPRMRWMDNMEEWTRMPFEDLLKKTRDRRKWSSLVHEATNPRIEDG